MKKSKKIQIFVAHHKEGFSFRSSVFVPIQVGKANSNISLKMQGDDEGDNISKLNPFYCEVTAIYWMWKNVEADFYGLNHYRRYFTPKIFSFRYFKERIKNTLKKLYHRGGYFVFWEKSVVNSDDTQKINRELNRASERIVKDIENGSIIVPRKCILINTNVENFFGIELGYEYIECLKAIVSEEECATFKKFFLDSLQKDFLYPANVFVFDRDTFERYCEILFRVLNKHLMLYMDNDERQSKYNRISGYMAELITNAFIQMCISDRKKYKEYNIMHLV